MIHRWASFRSSLDDGLVKPNPTYAAYLGQYRPETNCFSQIANDQNFPKNFVGTILDILVTWDLGIFLF